MHFLAPMYSLICVCIAEKKTDFKMHCPNHLPKNTKARGFRKQFEVMRMFPFRSSVNQPAANYGSITSAQIEKTIQ